MKLDQEYIVDQIPEQSYEPVPAGWYPGRITQAGVQQTKDGLGKYIKLQVTIEGPKCAGRVLYTNINLKNKSAKAEAIGLEELGAVGRATGLARVSDTDQLVGKLLSVRVTIRRSEEFGDQNDIKGYRAVSGSLMPGAVSSSGVIPVAGAVSASGNLYGANTGRAPTDDDIPF